nr:YpjP family protein [Lysinibacillus timonensis]
MKKWSQKIIVIVVAFITFGIISPNHEIWDLLDNDQSSDKNGDYQSISNSTTVYDDSIDEVENEHALPSIEEKIETIIVAAKEQSYVKFGSRIAPVIGDEFEEFILPKIEQVIDTTLARLDDETIRYINISNNPSGDYNEKVFNITNGVDGKDIIRFHVRTENRPQEGYYYNFHYHTVEDRFVTHHHVGDIFWSKNTPPKWLS